MQAQFPISVLLFMIEEGAAGGKEHLKVVPKKRQLLDSDEEEEGDEGRSKGSKFFSSNLCLQSEDKLISLSFLYLDILSHPYCSHSARTTGSSNPKEEAVSD